MATPARPKRPARPKAPVHKLSKPAVTKAKGPAAKVTAKGKAVHQARHH